MTDVKEICDAMLDEPAPPLRDAETALALARRATIRRRATSAATAGAAVFVAVVAALVAVPVLTAAPSTGHQSTVSAPARLVAPPGVPTPEAAQAHGDQVFALLLAAVPAGFQGAPEFPGGSTTGTFHLARTPAPTVDEYVSLTSVVVSQNGRQGLLSAHLGRDFRPVPEDLCATTRFDEAFGPALTCQVVVIDGVAVRVSTHTEPSVGMVTMAARPLQDGYLEVCATQGRWYFGHDSGAPSDAVPHLSYRSANGEEAPQLDAPALTGAQLAALAANPAMLP